MRRRLQSYKETIEASLCVFYIPAISRFRFLQQIERKLTSATQQVQYTPQGKLYWYAGKHP
jgi:hypothetical protein